MAMTSAYKSNMRSQRNITSEVACVTGMQYVDTPMQEGYVRNLINFDVDTTTRTARPRKGYEATTLGYTDHLLDSVPVGDLEYFEPIFTGDIYVNVWDTLKEKYEAVLKKIIIVSHSVDTQTYDMLTFSNDYKVYVKDEYGYALIEASVAGTAQSHTDAMMEYLDDTGRPELRPYYMVATYNHDLCTTTRKEEYSPTNRIKVHGIDAEQHFQLNCVTLSNNLYLFCKGQGAGYGYEWFRLEVWNKSGVWRVRTVTCLAKDITPAQALNYGYNLLKTNPYQFESEWAETNKNSLTLEGIVPYRDDKIALSAKVGEELTAQLILRTGIAFVTNAQGFMVRWEIADVLSDKSEVIQYVRSSSTYITGNPSITFIPPYKQFSIVAKVYAKKDVEAVPFTNHEVDNNLLTPLKTITLASYSLTDDTQKGEAELTTYSLTTARGMCTWKSRVVLWGVKNAETSIFLSDIDDPSWFPYPNMWEQLDGEILKCVPLLNDLIVLTRNRIYLLSYDLTGLSFTSKCVQDNLVLTREDMDSVIAVKNMLHFRQNNMYYMVVPKSGAMSGMLQIAPISTPIKDLLNNFETYVEEVFSTLFNFNAITELPSSVKFNRTLKDYCVYTEGSIVSNVYKFQIEFNDYKATYPCTIYIDLSLIYDSATRVWKTYVMGSTPSRLILLETNTLGDSVLCGLEWDKNWKFPINPGNPDVYKYGISCITLEKNVDICKDKLYNIGIRYRGKVPTIQYIDTGNRNLNVTQQKKFREVQFNINNLSDISVDMAVGISIDDVTRRSMYNYTLEEMFDPGANAYTLSVVPVVNDAGFVNRVDDSVQSKNTALYNGAVFDTRFKLNTVKFGNNTINKVRIRTNGKGYTVRLKLLTKCEIPYELLNINWVYRMKGAR